MTLAQLMKTQQLELQSEIELLKLQVEEQRKVIEEKENYSKHLQGELERLNEIYLELKRSQYGTKSERWQSNEQLVMILNEAEVESSKAQIEDDSTETNIDDKETEVKGHTRKRGGRKPLPKNLPREIVRVEVPIEEQFAEDGTPLKIIGYEVSEKLDYEPSKMKVIEIHRAKYGVDSGDYVKTAQYETILPKTMATEGLLAAIIVSKYADGTPLYRQEEIFKRADVNLSRTTTARWIIQVAEKLQPVWNVLSDRLLESFYVSCDETRFQVLKEKNRNPDKKSWMWVRSTPGDKNKIVLFDYDSSRASSVAEKLFAGYQGYVQVDGYSGYNSLEKTDGIIRVGCSMHARRYFESAFKIGSKSGRGLSEIALKYYQDLYDIEDECREKPPDERKQVRLSRAKPILDELKSWVDKNKPKVPPESKLGKAYTYFTNEYENLIRYLEDGRLEMDSGFVERAIRKFAIGRNNWLFADTEAGAHSSALLYSLIISMKINNVNPYKAMKYILTKLAVAKTIEDYEHLADVIIAVTPVPEK